MSFTTGHIGLCRFMLYAYHWPRTPLHDLAAVRAGAQMMSYGGDAAELLLLMALFATCYARRRATPVRNPLRAARRYYAILPTVRATPLACDVPRLSQAEPG